MNTKLRQATVADIEAMHRVRLSVHENRLASTITGADYEEHLVRVGRGWVIEEDGVIVAIAAANAQTGNIWALFVHPQFERRGLGRQLHDTMVQWLWAAGLKRLRLTTVPATRAQFFYEAAGWIPVGRTEHGELRFEMRRPPGR